ncbi:MAG: replication-associated recombination protein A [Deltaproteobacteria bacterium]|nr:replication-associated recombination protein A [Deltaproteobacteria bacterium]
MNDLFEYSARKASSGRRPLAERMRPRRLEEYLGQPSAVGEGKLVRRAIEQDKLFSMILWGPPGCGKTTLARLMATETSAHFIHFSAVLAGVKEIRSVIKIAREQQSLYRRHTVLFVDEIHRFNKAQQDAFLHHVESGLITLIGATTENPSFEVIPPLISRCRVIVLEALSEKDIQRILQKALDDRDRGLGSAGLTITEEALAYLAAVSDGDARTALNSLELTAGLLADGRAPSGESMNAGTITLSRVEAALQKKALVYDKSGEEHYNLISALHKSMRGSDPDAAAYWLERMLSAGENPLYVARRMVRFATEDVGMADPQALTVALNAMEAYRFLGSPEGELALMQCAIYLATAPKSNSVYKTYGQVKKCIAETGSLATPLHIRNAPTRLMRDIGYGKGYRYAHDFRDAFVGQEYLPQAIRRHHFYEPSDRGFEHTIQKRMAYWRRLKKEQQAAQNSDNMAADSGGRKQ